LFVLIAIFIAFILNRNSINKIKMKITQPKIKRESNFAMPLSRDELRFAEQSMNIFKRHTDRRGRLSFQIDKGKVKESVTIPAAAARLFQNILTQLSEGNSVTILPLQREVTTQQAADLLNVSRPYLIGLIDRGKIPSRKVGTHRRVYAKDILEFKRADDLKRSSALDELVKEAQKLDMGY
jgi:excisionase family DNA binding protein